MTDKPWLAIPAGDYEGHMGTAGVDQLGPLRAILADAYGQIRPARLAVLGCGTGNGLDVVDPAHTQRFVGVDLNPDYVALARQRQARLAGVAEWICADAATCALDPAGFDLIHAALLFEYVDPAAIVPRIAGWLAPGGVLSVVLQLPGGEAPISETGFESLQSLSALMALVPPERFRDLATRAGLTETSSRRIPLSRGKAFWAATFAAPRR
ncbi:MAG TPA: class I SAM-dependent methyltransferase [Polyangia bacterium]|nr:class I SAM-dependent methyltransferase [Polyangia bacterium]